MTALLPRAGASVVASGHPGAGEGRAVHGPARCALRIARGSGRMGHLRNARRVRCGRVHHRVFRDGPTGRGVEPRARCAGGARGFRHGRCATKGRRKRSRRCRHRRQPKATPGTKRSRRSNGRVPQSPPAQFPGAAPGRKPPRDARSAGDEARRPIEARSPDPEPPPAPIAAGDTVAASRAAPAPETQAAPTSDRRQVMAAALSRCERENFLAGFVCKERAWLQFCDGQWGEEPQCPSGVRSNNVR